MITVAPPGKYSVSPVLVMTVTDGGPNRWITSARGMPRTGNPGPTVLEKLEKGENGGLG